MPVHCLGAYIFYLFIFEETHLFNDTTKMMASSGRATGLGLRHHSVCWMTSNKSLPILVSPFLSLLLPPLLISS